jgi:hypothetical protein
VLLALVSLSGQTSRQGSGCGCVWRLMGDRVGCDEVEGGAVEEYGAYDKGPYPEEPRKGQLSGVVRRCRRGRRPLRRP